MPAPTATAIPLPAPAPPTAAPQPAFDSGGLGLARPEWERAHGRPQRDVGGFIDYEGGRFNIAFMGDNVWRIERSWGDQGAVPLDAARAESRGLIPPDATFVRTYAARGDRTVDLYTSESLKSRFPAGPWTGGEPGDLIVLATGNNP